MTTIERGKDKKATAPRQSSTFRKRSRGTSSKKFLGDKGGDAKQQHGGKEKERENEFTKSEGKIGKGGAYLGKT